MTLIHKQQLDVANFVAPNKTHPELSGVYIEEIKNSEGKPTGVKVVATDSYKLIEIKTKSAPEYEYPIQANYKETQLKEPIIIPAEVIKDMKKKMPKKNPLPILNTYLAYSGNGNQEDTATFYSTNLDSLDPTVTRIIKGKYPDYEQILPTDKPLVTVKVNAKYLMEITKIMSKTGRAGLHDITIEIYDSLKPIIFRNENEELETMAVLMPIKP